MAQKQSTYGDYLSIRSPENKEDDGWESQDIEGSDDDIKHQTTSEIVDKSKWQSAMFKVSRTAQTETWSHSDYYKDRIFTSTKWIIVPIFILFSIITIIVSILYFLGDIVKGIGFAIILALNIIGGILGAVMVYKYGTVEQVIDFIKLQNGWYDAGISKLQKQRETISKEAKQVHFQVHKLKKVSEDLDKQYKHFDDLRKQLHDICKDNESLKSKLDSVNGICTDLLVAIKTNERAHLLSIYYDLCERRHHDALTRADYKQFLARLNVDTRKEIEMQGGFDRIDKNNDGVVDVIEFQQLIDDVLEITQDQETKLLKKLTKLHYKK